VAEEARRIGLIEAAAPDPGAVMAAFRLPGTPVAMTPVAGAWSNRVYRLETTAGAYAVKELLNPWAEPRFDARLAEAWRFERAALAAEVAMPVPIADPATGDCAADVAREDGSGDAGVRVHRWAAGHPATVGRPVATDVGRWAGRTLAALHGLRRRPADRGLFPVPGTATADRWPELTEAAGRAGGASWRLLFDGAAGAVATVVDLVREGGYHPAAEVMSHADVSAKNVVLTSGGPVLCDWDVACPVVPRWEIADAALSLAAWKAHETAREVVRAYRAAGGDDQPITPPDLGAALASRLDWIALNVEVALGLIPASDERRRIAAEPAARGLRTLPRRVEIALGVESLLNV